jgi:bud emergence protein 1
LLPPYISRCQLVRQLFAPREGDYELDPKAMAEDFRLSGTSQHSSSAANSLSHQSSQGQMNGGSNYGSYAQLNQRNHPGQSQSPYQGGSVQRQTSSLTQASGMSSAPGNNSATNVAASGALKIKVFFEDDLIAIRVPGEITFAQLSDRLRERLKIREEIMIQYKDEPSGCYAELVSDRDLDVAFQRNPKLTLYVGYA